MIPEATHNNAINAIEAIDETHDCAMTIRRSTYRFFDKDGPNYAIGIATTCCDLCVGLVEQALLPVSEALEAEASA